MSEKPPFKMIIETDLEKWRYETWESKEPETIEWINSFLPETTFYDIGANIGIYSLYTACLYPNIRIFAFEPMQNNFIRLWKNIDLNMFKNINPFMIGIDEYTHLGIFETKDNTTGASGGQIGMFNYIDYYDKALIMCYSLPYCIKLFGMPDYIKIDVDGLEWDILKGLFYTWEDKPKSILIEINNDREDIYNWMEDNKFTDNNHFNKLLNHSRIRRAKEGIKAENVIFTRR